MFAAVLKNWCLLYGLEHDIESAGHLELAKGQSAAPDWLKLQSQNEIAVDLRDHQSRWIGDLDLSRFDLFLCMDAETVEYVSMSITNNSGAKVVLVNPPEGIPNPWQKGVDAYRECYSTIVGVVPQTL